MNNLVKSEISHDITRIESILSSGIFNVNSSNHPLLESAFVELMICLRDLMYKAEAYAERISFTSDLNINDQTKDITDTIRHVRDAICHINSPQHDINEYQSKVSFCCMFGKANFVKMADCTLSSEYKDDVCFFYGIHKLYLKRHIIRAFKEAKEKLT